LGADRSFVSLDFEPLLDKKRTSLTKGISVEIASGKFVTLDSIILNCSLTLGEFKCLINLVPMKLGSFDLIAGMDFMFRYHAKTEAVKNWSTPRTPMEIRSFLSLAG